jgi:DNA polymerase III subunit chi
MTSVDFYVLADGPEHALELLACKLSAKAMQGGHRIYIQAADESQARQLTELLWSFKAESFLPNQLAADAEANCPITIGHGEAPEHCDELLINLSQKIPLAYARFERLLELVPPQQEARASLRENYGHYRDRGYPIKTHEISL